jgi:hypothetical protein
MWLDRVPYIMPMFFSLALNEAQFDECLDHINISMRNRPEFLAKHAGANVFFYENKQTDSQFFGKMCAVVCIEPHADDPVGDCGLLVHEAVHIWQKVESMLGDFGPEGEAYHIQHISQELFKAYGERRAELEAAKS